MAESSPPGHRNRSRGGRFDSDRVADLYAHRPGYPQELTGRLLALRSGPNRVLDAGCGPGKLARRLAPHVDLVHAVDASPAMLRAGRGQPGGHHTAILWQVGRMEDVALDPPYGLAVAGAAFHWFDPDAVLPRLARALAPGAVLALVEGDEAHEPPWAEALREVMIDFVTRMEGAAPVWQPRDPARTPILDHPRFEPRGHALLGPHPHEQSIEGYVACQRSRATFTPEVMGPALGREFDEALRSVLEPHASGGLLRFEVRTRLEWGRPREQEASKQGLPSDRSVG